VSFLCVSNIERSLRFYLDALGFTMKNKWVVDGKLRWCWLQRGGPVIMLQEFATEGHDSWTPQGKVGDGVSLWFTCDDALSIYDELRSRAIEALEPQVGNGMWVTNLSDSDGYRINFESATDTCEDTKLSDVKS